MPDYRAYIVGSDGHFRNVVPLDCENDELAKAAAAQLVDGHDIELWQRDRRISVFKRHTEQSPAEASNSRPRSDVGSAAGHSEHR